MENNRIVLSITDTVIIAIYIIIMKNNIHININSKDINFNNMDLQIRIGLV